MHSLPYIVIRLFSSQMSKPGTGAMNWEGVASVKKQQQKSVDLGWLSGPGTLAVKTHSLPWKSDVCANPYSYIILSTVITL